MNKKTIGVLSFSTVAGIIGTAVGSHYLEIEGWVISKLISTHPVLSYWLLFGLLVIILLLVIVLITKTNQIKRTQDSQQIILSGCDNQIKTTQDQHTPVELPTTVGELKAFVVHHHELKTWERIKNAKQEIILHAAYYPKYGIDSDYSNAFRSLMRNNKAVKITVVITDIESVWGGEFGKILRYEFDDIEPFRECVNSSISFFKKLQKEYPDRITILKSSRLPLMPMVIIDNDILVGHYCHAEIPAPNGFWIHLNSDKIEKMMEYIHYSSKDNLKLYIDTLNDKEKAISRYIEDAFDAIYNGVII